jgi:hypothetical protein
MITKFHLISVAALAVSSIGYAGLASATLVSCPTDFTTDGTAKVYYLDGSGANQTAASACQYETPADPSTIANLTTVNSFGFFGNSAWEDNGQTQTNANAQTGSWSILSVDFVTYDYMIVFKDGAGTNLTGFLLNEEVSSGLWSTPFTAPPFTLPGNSKSADVSHFSIFRTTGDIVIPPEETPEPGVLLLMGAGLLGLGMARRRKSA